MAKRRSSVGDLGGNSVCRMKKGVLHDKGFWSQGQGPGQCGEIVSNFDFERKDCDRAAIQSR